MLDLDTEKNEKLEAEFNRLMERRAKESAKDEEQRIAEEESDKRLRARRLTRQEANRQAWLDFHGHMHQLHTNLALEHAARRSRLMLEDSPGPEAA